jgi:translation initiation factor 1
VKRDTNSSIVYTTGAPRDTPRPAAAGRSGSERCRNCQRPVAECVCKRGTPGKTSSDGTVRVSRETQGRKGKGVTVISGLGLPPNELEALATELKKRCGSGGGATGDGRIEIQGDHRDRLVEELTRRGWKARRAGG